jgi:NAD-dependent deacetylase
MEKPKIVVLTGAGISAESGIQTFRDADGLWENHRVEDVASPEGWAANPTLVLDFYNQRRQQLLQVQPNAGHTALVQLEQQYDVNIITQNIDNLHEQAGGSQVMHLHGELLKVRSVKYPELVYEWRKDLHLGDYCERGAQLRPHIVWFGEDVPLLYSAAKAVAAAQIVVVIGSSMQVYPAAGLVAYASANAPIYYIDPRPSLNYEMRQRKNLKIISETATIGVPTLVAELLLRG